MSQPIASSLFSAESDLFVARLSPASIIHYVFEGDLLGIQSPSVRKYGIAGNIVANEVLGQAELARALAL